MANVALPRIPVQDTYYFRQLIVNVFGIHDIASRKLTVFIYHEGEGGKGSNEVCSMLYMLHITNKISDEVKTLNLFGDNCAGQNKDHNLVRLMTLCETKRFDKINLGFMHNDRDFGIIRRKLRKVERYYETG